MTIDHFEIFVVKPKAEINYCINPSFEINTAGWNTISPNVLARSTDVQRRGAYSMKVTYNGSAQPVFAYSDNVTLSEGKHWFYADLWIPSSFDGESIKIQFATFTGATGTLISSADMTIRDDWQRIYVDATIAAGDVVGSLWISTENADIPTNGKYFYLDGMMMTKGDEPTTYFDGDTEGFTDEPDEYWWEFKAHASKSYRSGFSQAGGELIPISDYCSRIGVYGLGISPIQNVNVPLTDGSERYLYSQVTSRMFTIKVVFTGTTVGDIDTKRLALLDLINPSNKLYDQPLLLKFIGYDSNGKIDSKVVDCVCNYVGGLEQSPQTNTPYVVDVHFRMSGNYLQNEFETVHFLTTSHQPINPYFGVMMRDNEGNYIDLGGIGSTYIWPMRIVKESPYDRTIWFVGNFVNWGGDASLDYVVVFNGLDSSPKVRKPTSGNAPNGTVWDLDFRYQRTLIVGEFTSVGGVASNYAATINEDGSVTAHTGLPAAAKCVCWSNDLRYWYVGGTGLYRKSDGGTSFSTVTFPGSDVRVIKDFDDDYLYIYSNGDKKLYSYNKASGTFSAIFTISGGTTTEIYSIESDGKGTIFVGGNFTAVDGDSSHKHFVYFKIGEKIKSDPYLSASSVSADTVQNLQWINNHLMICGNFQLRTTNNLTTIENYGYWDNGNWSRTDIDFQQSTCAYVNNAFTDSRNNIWFMSTVSLIANYGRTNTIINEGEKVYPRIYFPYNSVYPLVIFNATNKKMIMVHHEQLIRAGIYSGEPNNTYYKGFDGKDMLRGLNKMSNFDFNLEKGSNIIRILTYYTPTDLPYLKYKQNFSSLDGWING